MGKALALIATGTSSTPWKTLSYIAAGLANPAQFPREKNRRGRRQ